jgi:hypothetical protein
MATWTLSSCKGGRTVDGALDEAIEAAIALDEELQPAGGVDVVDEAGDVAASVDNGEVDGWQRESVGY